MGHLDRAPLVRDPLSGTIDAYILTMVRDAPRDPVVPRRVTLTLAPGTGRLECAATPAVDATFQRSVRAAWDTARALTGRSDVDARLAVAGLAPIAGSSAGLPVGLLALSALLGGPQRLRAFATGGVLDARGDLEGGRATIVKATAAAEMAAQVGLAGAPFFSPPVEAPTSMGDLPIVLATDLGSALARLCPPLYAHVAERHRALRRATDGVHATVDAARPFAIVSSPTPVTLPTDWAGVQVAAGPRAVDIARGAWVTLGDRGVVLWRAYVEDADRAVIEIPRLMAFARAASVA